jgi:hypothetical protein
MQSHHLVRRARLLAAGVVVFSSLTAGCQAMAPHFSPPEPSVGDIPPTSYFDQFYDQFYAAKKCKTKSDPTRHSVSAGPKPTGPRPLSSPAAPRIEKAITAPRPPAPVVSPGTPKSTGQRH